MCLETTFLFPRKHMCIFTNAFLETIHVYMMQMRMQNWRKHHSEESTCAKPYVRIQCTVLYDMCGCGCVRAQRTCVCMRGRALCAWRACVHGYACPCVYARARARACVRARACACARARVMRACTFACVTCAYVRASARMRARVRAHVVRTRVRMRA